MRKGSRFLIGLAAAGLTFGTLTATLGPKHYSHGFGHRGCGHWTYSHHDHCGSAEQNPSAPANDAH